MKSYLGKILLVDLTTRSFEERTIPDSVYEQYLSGVGLAARISYDLIPAGADPLEHPVFTDVEAFIFALQELLGLKKRENAIADELPGVFWQFARHDACRIQLFHVGRKPILIDDLAAANQVHELRGSRWCRHPS